MNAIHAELLSLLDVMDNDQQSRLLQMARQMVHETSRYTALDLIALPAEERERLVAEAVELAAGEDFEVFEAYLAEGVDDD